MVADPFDQRQYRSVSQLKQYERCPYSYYLARVQRAWQRPAAWLPQGSAVHAAIEAWERSGRTMSLVEAQGVFSEEYAKEVAEYTEITPNFSWWFKSGPYDGSRDLARRFEIGKEQVGKYVAYATRAEHEAVWITPDGTPAIELAFDMDLDGVLVRGYIDAIVEKYEATGAPALTVRDHKTGNHPGDDFQLAVYAVAIGGMFGAWNQPSVGDYWMGRSGKPTHPFDLSEWTREAVSEKFRELEENIRAERFDPHPEESKCRFCDVSYACQYSL